MKHLMSWRREAACARVDPETAEKFFPAGRPAREPRSVCKECPVREECLEFALASPWQPAAIVAGMTPGELAPLWRQRHPYEMAQGEIRQLLGLW